MSKNKSKQTRSETQSREVKEAFEKVREGEKAHQEDHQPKEKEAKK